MCSTGIRMTRSGQVVALAVDSMSRKNGMLLRLLIGAVLAFAAQEARSDIVIRTTDFGEGADAYVRGGQSVVNFGTAPVLVTRNQTGSANHNYKDYLRFDLSGSDLDLFNAISVTLEFVSTTSRSGVGFEFYGLPDGLPGDTTNGWTETGITYANAPGNPTGVTDRTFLTSPPGDENGNYLTLLGSLPNETTGSTSSPVTHSFSSQSLLDLIRNDNNSLVTIALRRLDTTQGIVELASKENLSFYDFPTLTITAPGIPEPSAFNLGLFSVLLLGYGVWRTNRKTTPNA